MRTKKLFTTLLSIVVICVLMISLSACLKIGLQKDNVIAKLQEEGATVEYARSTPMTIVGQDSQDLNDMLRVTYDVDGKQEIAYVVYAGNKDSAVWVEECCESYITEQAEKNPEPADGETDFTKWIIFDYDYMVVCGNIDVVTLIRGY